MFRKQNTQYHITLMAFKDLLKEEFLRKENIAGMCYQS